MLLGRLLMCGLFAATGSGALAQSTPPKPHTAEAIFAGGCFWCMEEAFEKLPGVVEAVSGYTGGQTPNPDYRSIGTGKTGHAEAVKVVYDTQRLTYGQLLTHFWKNIDPTQRDGQFCDQGNQYRSGIFALTPAQKAEADKSKQDLIASGRFKDVHTTVENAGVFYLAEDYHQDYYKHNPLRYKAYKTSCGRAGRLEQLWGKK